MNSGETLCKDSTGPGNSPQQVGKTALAPAELTVALTAAAPSLGQ